MLAMVTESRQTGAVPRLYGQFHVGVRVEEHTLLETVGRYI